MSAWKLALAGALILVVARAAQAQGLYIYPAHGQTQAQQQQDQFQCSGWAAQQTGFDPNAPPPSTQVSVPPIGGPFLFGRIRRYHYEQAEEAGISQAMAAYNSQKAAYHRAMTACLTARGYSVY